MSLSLHVRTRLLDDDRPLTQLLPTDRAVLWSRHGEGFAGWGTAVRVSPGTGEERFAQADASLRAIAGLATFDDGVGVPGEGLVAFASMTFDERTGGSVLEVPRRIVGRRGGVTWLTEIDGTDLPEPVPPIATSPLAAPLGDRVRFAGSSMPDVHWLEAVAEAVKRIDAGELGKVVLARDHAVWSREPFDARWLAHRLAERFPSCFTFLVQQLIGATPELLVRRDGRHVRSLALAGSVGRGSDPASDAAAAAGLLASDKDHREHAYAAASVVEPLAALCDDVTASPEPFVLTLDNVHHLATEVTGTLRDDRSALALAAHLHPTAAVGGAPTSAAVTLIRELEGMDRGRYAGPVGWVAADGDGEFGIALRCAELSGARARLFAGAGIVSGSLPEDELEETRIKLRAVQGVLGG